VAQGKNELNPHPQHLQSSQKLFKKNLSIVVASDSEI
jgi:hypothetical protein